MKEPWQCESCDQPKFKPNERFCKACRKAVLSRLYSSGCVRPIPYTRRRSDEEMEDTRATKYGTGY